MSTNTTLKVFPVGTQVKLTDDIFGTIDKVIINYGDVITYCVSWWNGRSISSETFFPEQFTVEGDPRQKIGFA